MKKAKRGHGEGSIRRRGEKFEAAVLIGDKRKTATLDTRAKAVAWIAATRTDADRGVAPVAAPPKPERMLFEDACRALKVAKTKPTASKRWRPETVREFDNHAGAVLVPYLRGRFVDEITDAHVEDFKSERLKTVSPATVNHALAKLKQVLRFSRRKGWVANPPPVEFVDCEEHNRKSRDAMRMLRPHEIRAFLQALPDTERRAFFVTMFFTGLRRSEMFRMRWDWVDLEAKMLKVKIAKKGSNEIPMSDRVVAELTTLKAYRASKSQPMEAVFLPLRASKRWRESQESGATIDRGGMKQAMRSALVAARIDPKGVGYHTFRRAFSTIVETLPGASYAIVRDLLRHRGRTVTDRYLLPAEQAKLRHALAALEVAVLGTANVIILPAAV